MDQQRKNQLSNQVAKYSSNFFYLADSPQCAKTSSFTRFLDHTQRSTTVGRTPSDEWLARRRDLYLTKHNTHNRQTSTPPAGFEPTFSADERPLGQAVYKFRYTNIPIHAVEKL